MTIRTKMNSKIVSRLIVIAIFLMGAFTVSAEGRDPETDNTIHRVPGDELGVFCNLSANCWLVKGDEKINRLRYDDWDVAKKNFVDGTFLCPGVLVNNATMSVYLWSVRDNKWIPRMACIVPRVSRPYE